ncbi:TspO/MBR family protein [Halorussus aquaticus]|uniref:TspO/MBR family protein n=1 Tax=Halorussus aquaticus TaxID=2953748 RepID=A0ABD5Q0Y5_9EURY|nr:TspO/MBR family protein [Halorussus aquaticus]
MTLTETPKRGDRGGNTRWAALVASVLVCELAGIVPSILTADEVATWYPTLVKPAFTPPSWVFGPVWTALYLLMGVALYLVWRSDRSRVRRTALALFGVQLALNAAWTLVFFGSQAIVGGLAVIVALLALVVATVAAFARIDRRAAALLVPYLLWVGFATALNYELWRLN